jgi:hypothetical protein
MKNLPKRPWLVATRRVRGFVDISSTLSARVIRKDGQVEDLGVISRRVVTTAFVNFLVDQLQAETSEIGDFKYHGSGIGTGDEAVGDTDLGSAIDEARDAGTQTEGASANIYKSVATHIYGASYAVTEHGVFSQAGSGNPPSGGTLMDRSKFSAINVDIGDAIEFTYEITFSPGS